MSDPAGVRPIAICGHPRSGTSLLFRIANSHPDIFMTTEFNCFHRLDVSFPAHARSIRKSWFRRPIIVPRDGGHGRGFARMASGVFLFRYLVGLLVHSAGPIGFQAVLETLHRLAPWAKFVGDKKPNYIRRLDVLLRLPGLACIVIYRDCRDVASSVLAKIRGPWAGRPIAGRLSSAAQIAYFWIDAIETMERHAGQLKIIRYEMLATDPQPVLFDLGNSLGIDGRSFEPGRIRSTSIGNYRRGLTKAELGEVLDIAGPTMQRLGYS